MEVHPKKLFETSSEDITLKTLSKYLEVLVYHREKPKHYCKMTVMEQIKARRLFSFKTFELTMSLVLEFLARRMAVILRVLLVAPILIKC
jgi:hypothetical protein